MNAAKEDPKEGNAASGSAVRASISFPPEVYEMLENIAKEKEGFAGMGRPRYGGKIYRGEVAPSL